MLVKREMGGVVYKESEFLYVVLKQCYIICLFVSQ
jgi:hypothetical protein